MDKIIDSNRNPNKKIDSNTRLLLIKYYNRTAFAFKSN